MRFHAGANSDGPQAVLEAGERFLVLDNDVKRKAPFGRFGDT
jgi:hypothetical protein